MNSIYLIMQQKCIRCDTSEFPKKVDLANLKSNADKLDIDELKKYTY